MADRVDFYFRQRVTEAELDLAFELLEKADRDLATDLGIYGIVTGAEPVAHTPVNDLSIDLTSPTRAYDRLGRRIAIGTNQTVSCASDHQGIPTTVQTSGHERWVGVFLRFSRQLSDPRTDGNAQEVYFRRDEAHSFAVRQAPEGAVGVAQRPPLEPDELLICDIRLRYGQTQIRQTDIYTDRRQAFVFAASDAVSIQSGVWQTLFPSSETVQASFDATDDVLTQHFAGSAHRHQAAHVKFTPTSFLTGQNLQTALVELLQKLTATTQGSAGARRIGAESVTGTPNALPPSTISNQLALLLGWLNGHMAATQNAHPARAISALPHLHITSTNVQAQLEEIVSDLKSTNPSLGATQVGNGAIPGTPYALQNGTARSHLTALLSAINIHATGTDHDDRYWLRTERVADSSRLQGQPASSFAPSGHDHDTRYMRRVYSETVVFEPGESKVLITLGARPDLVTYAYNYLENGLPQATTYVRGNLTNDLRVWVTKRAHGNDKDFELKVWNTTSTQLAISVAAFRVGA